MPYDHALCESLVKVGCRVDFFGSFYVHTEWKHCANYSRKNHFYKFTNWLYKGRAKGFLRRYIKSIEHIFSMAHFIWLIKSLQPDVIHFQWSQLPFIDRFFLPILKKISPLIYTVHNSTTLHGERPLFYFIQRIDSSFLNNFDCCIAHTNYSKKTIAEKLSISTVVIPHGLLSYYSKDGQFEGAVTNKYKISSEERIILFFGNISHYKGLDILIEAFALFSESELLATRMLVVGRPNFPIKPLQDLAESMGVARRIIWDLRYISEEEVHPIISACSLMVMPYRHIDQSGVLMTVINYGKPIVASRLGGFEEIIKDGIHGKLVTPENPKELAAALVEIIMDEKLTDKMGQSVKKLANDLSLIHI